MSLKFYRLDVNIQIDSCRIQRNFNADATVLPAKSKEKEPALSVCKLFSLCRSGCSALGFFFSRSGSDSAVPAPQTVHRPQAQSRETPLLVFRAQMPMVFAAIETTCATLL